MKKIIRCKKCGERVLDYGVGFTKNVKLKCTYHDIDVDPDDGCTMGHEGDPKHVAVRPININSLNGHESVYG